MNKSNLKSYAPKARLDFIKAVTERANVLGISAAGVVPVEVRGDVALIDGREWPAKVAGQRDELIARIKRHGFEQTMDEVAYTWFNRFAALRYMEIHDYLGHGWRVLSSRDDGLPEILRHASEVTLPGLNANRAREMQLAGNQDNELYKLLLVAQCNELSRVMPFLFERIDDETELLLPENLLRTDSIVAKLVEQVPEQDWQEIEVIGWLYQFYISEKKDQVIGKVVKSEDIPAATQLFTPNWIVQYLVQNSVGRLWLMANPTSALASQWPYYIQPAEQTPEVQAQLDALIQTRIREDGETLNPETITVLDPACGSGHILVVAYDVLKAIYLERGYQPRSIPRLILENNLYGLDIDDRAAQLAAFALLMRARADDRRLFVDPPKLNVLSMKESKGLDVDEVARAVESFGIQRGAIKALLDTFEHAKTFGSLAQVPASLTGHLPAMAEGFRLALQQGDLYARHAAQDLAPLVCQAMALERQFDAVVGNPPYMGGKGMNVAVKDFAKLNYPISKADLYSMFLERGFQLCKPTGLCGLVTMQSWMFLSSFESLRAKILQERTFSALIQIGYNSFPELNSKIAQACAFCAFSCSIARAKGTFVNLNIAAQSADKSIVFLNRTKDITHFVESDDFRRIPGNPIAYWISPAVRLAFTSNPSLGDAVDITGGMTTGDNEKYLRLWHEVSVERIGFGYADRKSAAASHLKWFPYNKGGPFRRWYGNNYYVVNWEFDGREIQSSGRAFPRSKERYFSRSITYSATTSLYFGARHADVGFLFDAKGSSAFIEGDKHYGVLSFFASNPVEYFLKFLNPTVEFQTGDLARLPLSDVGISNKTAQDLARRAIEISKADWDVDEISWEYMRDPIVAQKCPSSRISDAWQIWEKSTKETVEELRKIEEQNNQIWIDRYELRNELSPQVRDDQITLIRAERSADSQRLVAYAIGCMAGRYSLSEPGLIYARAGNVGFDPSRYDAKFPADSDGILPLSDEGWFEDDSASRVQNFLRAVWGVETLEENMVWLAESLGTKESEAPIETFRRYLVDKFFKDHLQTYKKRPIYWLFSSGKQGAFQALVYLHRYNEGTLARMRAEYVVPLIAKMASRLEMLDKDVAAASSAAARSKLQKQIESLRKKQIELLAYDEKLRHYADMRIQLNLDDGVKVNYAKFGDLVAEAKAITGGSDE